MSEVPANTSKRQAIVERLRQRIDSFRKHHDSCQARLEETQPSRELKQQQESRLIQEKILDNKNKMNAKIRPDQVSKIPKQEEIASVGQEKAASSTGLQSAMKRPAEFPPSQIDGERSLQNHEDLATPVPQKYPRFDNPNDVHFKMKAPSFTGEGDPSSLANNMAYPTVNGHNGDFPKSELSKAVSTYSGSMSQNIDRTITRPQQYGGDFSSSAFPNAGQSSVSNNSRTPDFPVNFKQESDLVNPDNDVSTSMANGFQGSCSKSEGDYSRLLTDYSNTKSKEEDMREQDLKSQISQFELVLQGIKNRDENPSDCDTKSDIGASKQQPLQVQNPPLGNGFSDGVSHDVGNVGKGNQLGLSNGSNNGTQLPTVPVTSSTQQHRISRSTAEALHQFVIAQQEERLTKVRYERNPYLNSQGIGREQNSTRMTQRANHFPPIRQRVFEQIQQRRTNQLKSKVQGPQTTQMHARNPVMTLGTNSPFPMHAKVRYPNMSPRTPQPVAFSPASRVQQNLMPQMHQASSMQQTQPQAQLQNIPRHQISMIAQQKLAFQQQMVNRLPTYTQSQHLPHSSSMMDIRQKFTGGVQTSHSTQYPVHQQATRTPQPLSHLQHYPNAYSNQGGPASRPLQPAYTGEYSGYQHPHPYNVNQESKLHAAYQRHVSMDDNMVGSRYHNQDLNNKNNFSYHRSSSLPGHAVGAKNVFDQTSPPVVRLGPVKPNLPDMNNNGNDHQSQELGHLHPQPSLTHMKTQHVPQTSNMTLNQDQSYQGSTLPSRSCTQTAGGLQQTFSSSFSNLLDLKSNSESSLFPFLGTEIGGGGNTDSTDFDSLLKSPPSDFDLLNILESEPSKTLQ